MRPLNIDLHKTDFAPLLEPTQKKRGGKGGTRKTDADHRIAVPNEEQRHFVVRLTEIPDMELERRESRLIEMGNSPLDDAETRRDKSLQLMGELWNKAQDIVAQTKDHMVQKLQERGKCFSELQMTAVVFANLLVKNALDFGCISCQMQIGDNVESRFFPVEIMERERRAIHADAIKKFAEAIKDLPEISDLTEDSLIGGNIVWPIYTETVKSLSDDCLTEQEQTINILSAVDWCDSRLILDLKNLKAVAGLCTCKYRGYREQIQMIENANLFDQMFPEGHERPSQDDVDPDTFVDTMDFDFDI
ncbi:MAG: hypothetical protein LBB16_00325 [Puniceicoccales bacterium]|jgi:hypothetical protein|nr:hypothetical protein [Puniceicoccales bacterium]